MIEWNPQRLRPHQTMHEIETVMSPSKTGKIFLYTIYIIYIYIYTCHTHTYIYIYIYIYIYTYYELGSGSTLQPKVSLTPNPRRTAPFPPKPASCPQLQMCSPLHSQAATKWRQSPPSRRIKIGLPEPEILWWIGT